MAQVLPLALVPISVLLLTLIAFGLRALGGYFIWASNALGLVAILLGGWLRFRQAVRDVRKRRITVNVFVSVAITASLLIGQVVAAAVIVFIMSAAGGLEAYTVKKTRSAIRSLLDLAPMTARLKTDDGEREVPVEELRVGDVIVVQTGERIAADGTVISGQAAVNQAAITGESIPVDRGAGDEVFTGTLNEAGTLFVEVARVGADTTLARIVHLVEVAQDTKAPVAQMADRFTAWFLPAVLTIAVGTFLYTGEVTRAVAVLLVACPCALAIATPSAVTAGIANLARRGVLVKGGVFLELAGRVRTVVLDKTGTTTAGRPTVERVVSLDGRAAAAIVADAAAAERYSHHPLGRAIVEHARSEGLQVVEPEEHGVSVGRGVWAKVSGQDVTVGNRRHLEAAGITTDAQADAAYAELHGEGMTSLGVARNGRLVGLIGLADKVRPDVPEAVDYLRALGVDRVLLFTGDNPSTAEAARRDSGVDAATSEMLPQDKQEEIKKLRQSGTVAMIGDGINDAPSLAEADIGFAMGAAGTDVAMDAADICLMEDDLRRVADTIYMSRKVLRRIGVNIALSMLYNAVGITLSSTGLLNPVPAVLYQELGCLSVIVSSTLLLSVDPEKHRRSAARTQS